MASEWFPNTATDVPGWRLDIVSLLAVIGESSMAEHAQTITASWLCCLPRIVPAPQVLLKPTRPTRMPQVNAAVVGVKNGTFVQSLNYFPNILHPIEELPAFAFRVYEISHSTKRVSSMRSNSIKKGLEFQENGTEYSKGGDIDLRELPAPVTATGKTTAIKTDFPQPRRRGTGASLLRKVTHSNQARFPPHVPVKRVSPLNALAVFSCVLTMGLFGLSAANSDGVACLALLTISLASSIVGFASMWSPQLMKRNSLIDVPRGDVVIRTREGAFIVVRCDENVARELYTGTEECIYKVQNLRLYRVLVGVGTFFLMISVVLLGNCNFPQQAAIGGSYIALNGLYWGAALISKRRSWNLSLYDFKLVTPQDGLEAHIAKPDETDPEKLPSYTRTLWYAIRETREIGWVKKSGAAPVTREWDRWLKEAENAAIKEDFTWPAVSTKDQVVGQTEETPLSPAAPAIMNGINVPGGQHAPLIEIPPNDQR